MGEQDQAQTQQTEQAVAVEHLLLVVTALAVFLVLVVTEPLLLFQVHR
jgi:hypothetical protein